MKVHVYVVTNISGTVIYVGLTADLVKRLKEHNAGKSKFTKAYRPWKVVYFETFNDYSTARIREKYLKSTAGKKWMRKNNILVGGSLPA